MRNLRKKIEKRLQAELSDLLGLVQNEFFCVLLRLEQFVDEFSLEEVADYAGEHLRAWMLAARERMSIASDSDREDSEREKVEEYSQEYVLYNRFGEKIIVDTAINKILEQLQDFCVLEMEW